MELHLFHPLGGIQLFPLSYPKLSGTPTPPPPKIKFQSHATSTEGVILSSEKRWLMLKIINKRKACTKSMIQYARWVCPTPIKRKGQTPYQIKRIKTIKNFHGAILSQSGSDSKCSKNPIPVGIAHVGETISLRLS